MNRDPSPQSTAEDHGWITAQAERLFTARQTGIPTDLVTAHCPDITPEQAQRIATTALAMTGDRQCGFKLGYTSAAMRRQMNIDRPNFGRLCQRMDFGQGTPDRLIHPRVEPEIALRLGRDIVQPPGSLQELLAAVDAVLPALEIVDTRYHDYVFRFEDNVADNSSAAGFVLGQAHPARVLEGEGFAVSLETGSENLAGHSSAAMGGPLEALGWLCRELAAAEECLPAGSIVLTGGLTAAPYLVQGSEIRARFGLLGTVSCRWQEASKLPGRHRVQRHWAQRHSPEPAASNR